MYAPDIIQNIQYLYLIVYSFFYILYYNMNEKHFSQK